MYLRKQGGTHSLKLTRFPINVVPTPFLLPNFSEKIILKRKSANVYYQPKAGIQERTYLVICYYQTQPLHSHALITDNIIIINASWSK